MENREYILLEDCCSHYSIEASFIMSLNEHGLINLIQTEQSYAIDYEQLSLLEKYTHMHYELDINLEGLEVIRHLLQKIEHLQAEVKSLKSNSL